MIIRKFEESDAEHVSELIIETLSTTNRKDYSKTYLDAIIRHFQPHDIIEKAVGKHFYVVEEEDEILGCGAIGPYMEKEDESCLFMIFVHPSYQGKGIGRKIMDTLEKDPYFLRAKRIEIPASITGTPFYLKLGYTYKNGIKELDAEELYRLEKHRSADV